MIEQLGADQCERETFLRSSSLDGLLLAVSTAGGAEGARELPLIRGDSDWDALADHLAELIATLDEPDLTRLFIALAEAQAAITDDEIDHLAGGVLRLVARRWSRDHAPIPVGLLAGWLELARTVDATPARPELAATWFELAPTAPVEIDVQAEIIRFDDWTVLCELLREHAPEALTRFGFPREHGATIEDFVAAARAAATDPAALPHPRRELLASILWRLNRLGAADPIRTANVAARLTSVREEFELPELYPRREVSPELQQMIDAPTTTPGYDEELVARVLRDL